MSGRGDFVLPKEFWEPFVQKHWEREPGVFPAVFPGPILSPDETLVAMRLAFGALQAGDPGDRPRCYLEGTEVTLGSMYAQFIPTAADETLEAYSARISKTFDGRGFGVVINAFHVHAPELWYRLRGFFRGLYALTGLPAAKTDPVLFVGNYPVTPFGVHTDRASIFTFSIGAKKRMLMWNKPYFEQRGTPMMEAKLLVDHGPFQKDAVDLQIGPRDLMYWPSSYWHIGVAASDVQATLGVGVYFSAAQEELTHPALRLAVAASNPAPLKPMPAVGTQLPEALERTLKDVATAVQSGALRREVHAEWLRRVSSDGCLPPPALNPIPLDVKDRVQLADGGPILHAELSDGLLIAANGQSWFLGAGDGRPFDAASTQALVAVLDELNRGERVRVGQAVRGATAMGPTAHQLLVYLAAAGSIRKYGP